MTRRYDLSDGQWAAIAPLLPVGRRPGRPPRRTKRQLIDGIRWRIRTGTAPGPAKPFPTERATRASRRGAGRAVPGARCRARGAGRAVRARGARMRGAQGRGRGVRGADTGMRARDAGTGCEMRAVGGAGCGSADAARGAGWRSHFQPNPPHGSTTAAGVRVAKPPPAPTKSAPNKTRLASSRFPRAGSSPRLVELRGLEPLTPTLPVWCATSCATAPYRPRSPGHGGNTTHRGQVSSAGGPVESAPRPRGCRPGGAGPWPTGRPGG